MKTCKNCNIEKPLDAFMKWRCVCKECRNSAKREASAKKRAEKVALIPHGMKFCNGCKEFLPIDVFSSGRAVCKPCRSSKEAERARNAPPKTEKEKQARLEYRRKWQKENPDKIKQYAKTWYEKNPEYQSNWYQDNREKKLKHSAVYYLNNKEAYIGYRHTRRARESEAFVETVTVPMLRKMYGNNCTYCGIEMDFKNRRGSPIGCQLDHKQPLHLGGKHSLDNCVLACRTCNLSKGYKSYEEWLEYLEQKTCQ